SFTRPPPVPAVISRDTDNPIAHGLDVFHSIARRKGVYDIAAVDRLIADDVRVLASHLLFRFEDHAVARGNFFDDLVKVAEAIITNTIEIDHLRPLLRAAITKAGDKALWGEVLTLITASLGLTATHTATRPPTPHFDESQNRSVTATQISTPNINISEHHSLPGATIPPISTVSQHFQSPSRTQYTAGSVTSLSEYRKENELRLLLQHELKGRLGIDTPGFLDAFFPSNEYQQTAEKFLDRCKAGVVPAFHNGWKAWPDGAAETEVAPWLKLVTDKLEEFSRASLSSDVSHRRAILGIPRKPSRGSVAMQELDVGFVYAADLEGSPEGSAYSCARMLARGEVRRDPMADEAQETRLALARNAQDMLKAQSLRRFFLGFTLCGPLMRVWLFDRLGGIASEQININTDPLQFIKVILGFLWMSEEDLGFDSSIKGPDLTVEGADGKKHYIEIEQQDDPELILVVKDSWQEVKGDEEGDMLLLATRKGVVNVARHYHHETVQVRDMNDDVHACVRRGLVKATTASNSAQSDSESSSRAPSERLRKRRRGTSMNPSTSAEEEGSGLHPRKKICSSWPTDAATEPPTELRNRVHHRIIVQDYGKPIYKASSRQALLACLEGCIKGHQSLYEAGILHRDISINNLMINEERNESWPHFLIDLDHAIEMDRHDTSNERTKTGTRAFMAIGLLQGEEHSFLHDLESFFWVLFWTCIHYGKSGKDSRRLPRFAEWNSLDDFDLLLDKQNMVFAYNEFIYIAECDFMPYYKPLIPYVNQLRELLPYVTQLPGLVYRNSTRVKKTGLELYSQMINVLREAQEDPEVCAE
ncbi:hypothetical protein E4U32_005426, partial [Claviceps aff. humidiphila group G2b]